MHFTYLLGAGASFEKLPLVKDFPERLDAFRDLLYNKIVLDEESLPNIKINKKEARNLLLQDINWLIGAITNHTSVDTLARKLYLKGDEDKLKKLKGILDIFFFIEQVFNGYDKRYDTFFATILGLENDRIELPKNINIVSWNYDFQIELTLASYLDVQKISTLENLLQIMPRKEMSHHDISKFSIYKLNGTAGGITYNPNKFNRFDFNPLKISNNISEEWRTIIFEDNLEKYLFSTKYSNPDKNRISSILFSWEKDPIPQEVRETCARDLMLSEYLVIIGYSFPTFNRETDKFILNQMENLKKIFIQSPEKTIDSVEVRLKSLLSSYGHIEFEKVRTIDEFYIPFEYA